MVCDISLILNLITMKPYQFLFLIVSVLVACNRSSKKPAPIPIQAPPGLTNIANQAGMESFDEFNSKFHSDSSFQLSRIKFPIGGQCVNDLENTTWSNKNWEFLKTPVSLEVDTLDCRHSLTMTDTLVTEKFWIDQSGFKVERRFRLKNGKWFLVYYDDINM
jgi:hypothetical protein